MWKKRTHLSCCNKGITRTRKSHRELAMDGFYRILWPGRELAPSVWRISDRRAARSQCCSLFPRRQTVRSGLRASFVINYLISIYIVNFNCDKKFNISEPRFCSVSMTSGQFVTQPKVFLGFRATRSIQGTRRPWCTTTSPLGNWTVLYPMTSMQ